MATKKFHSCIVALRLVPQTRTMAPNNAWPGATSHHRPPTGFILACERERHPPRVTACRPRDAVPEHLYHNTPNSTPAATLKQRERPLSGRQQFYSKPLTTDDEIHLESRTCWSFSSIFHRIQSLEFVVIFLAISPMILSAS